MKLSSETVALIEASHAFLPEIGKGTGYRPEPEDERDFRLKSLLGSPVPPPRASLREHVPPVRDQGQQGSCTGFATASGVGTLVRKASAFETVYSPQHIYNLARMQIGELHLDEGAYIRDAVGAVRKVGAARERDLPYYEIQDVFDKPPPEKAMQSARSWRLGAHYRCHTLNDVKRAISAGYPVVFGFLVYSNISQAVAGRIPEPGGYLSGGHAVMGAEYDDTKGVVGFPNSWGRAWGDRGWGYLPYTFWDRGLVNDAWAMVDESADTQYPKRGEEWR